MKKPIPSLFLAGALLSLTACQQLQQLDNMNTNTTQMNASTAQLKQTTDQTKAVLGYMEDLGRQGESLDLRNKTFANLVNDMHVDQKLLDADLFINAFEFQLWENSTIDPNIAMQERDLLARDSVNEFFNRLQTLDHWDAKDIDPFAGGGPHVFGLDPNGVDNQKAVFNMLAATIHAVNRIDDTASKNTSLSTRSMFSLLQDGLLASKSIREGKSREGDYPAYVMMVRRNEPLAIRLLKARYSELGLILVGRITDISGNLMKAFGLKYLGQHWKFDMNSMNSAQIEYYKLHLDYAKATKDLLVEIGENVELDKSVKDIYSHMEVVSTPEDKLENHDLNTAQQSMREALTEYMK